MKKYQKFTGIVCGLGLALGCGFGTLSASATSVGDVIAHAYAVGLPEAQIQQCIAQYSGREYTSEQCDQAIAALDSWAAKRDEKIQNEIDKGTTTAAANGGSTAETTTTAAASNNTGSAGNSADNTSGNNSETPSNFSDMTLDEKVSYINSLPEDERSSFVQNMTNDERNSFLKQLDTADQMDIISGMAEVGDAFGIQFSVDSVSDGTISISAHDADGNLVGVSTFGDTVEETGIPYTVPILIGGGAIILASAGLGALLYRGKNREAE